MDEADRAYLIGKLPRLDPGHVEAVCVLIRSLLELERRRNDDVYQAMFPGAERKVPPAKPSWMT